MTTVLVGRDGIVRHASLGMLTADLLRQLVEKELFGMPKYLVQRQIVAPKEGDTFPNITIEDIENGEQISLYSMFHSYAIVAYFSSNCGCTNEHKGIQLLNKIVANFGQNGKVLSAFGVFGTRYPPEQIQYFRESGHISFRADSSTEILNTDYLATENADPLIVLVNQKRKISLLIDVNDDESRTISKVYSIIKENEGT